MYFFALKYTKNKEDALDVVQNAFMAAYCTIGTLQRAEAFHSWLCGIVYNQCLKVYRRREKLVFTGNNESILNDLKEEAEYAIPGMEAEKRDRQRWMSDIIEALPREQSATILMFYYQQKSVSEIAEIMGCAAGTAKSRLTYGRKAIKKKIDDLSVKHGMEIYSGGIGPQVTETLEFMATESIMSLDDAHGILMHILNGSKPDKSSSKEKDPSGLSAATGVYASLIAKFAALVAVLALGVVSFYFLFGGSYISGDENQPFAPADLETAAPEASEYSEEPTQSPRAILDEMTERPPDMPTPLPTASPTEPLPVVAPSETPSPTEAPTPVPTATVSPSPTKAPTPVPTATASPSPTEAPAPDPTATASPSPDPTATASPTPLPTATTAPTESPTPSPIPSPTTEPTPSPTPEPTASPIPEPTPSPTPEPTLAPPSEEPTDPPAPTAPPTEEPTPPPSEAPTQEPSPEPSEEPTMDPRDEEVWFPID
jgi:RNA polymerase sigma factor (sigma-70 family)